MKGIVVYHGGTEIVTHPVCKFGRRYLDFGQGFMSPICGNRQQIGQCRWLTAEMGNLLLTDTL